MDDLILRGKYDAKVVNDFGFVPKRDDLILRAAAIDAAFKGADDWDGGFNPKYLMAIPAVDAVPVVHGRWGEDCDCSVCGFKPYYEFDIHTLSYCPNCGAKNVEE